MKRADDTPPGTARIPGEGDWVKARAGTLLAIATVLIGGAAWATKMTMDMAQVKADLADLKSYVMPPPPVTRATLEPHKDHAP